MNNNNGIWIRCEQCKHKLFNLYPYSVVNMSIKCHSCKKVNFIHISYDDIYNVDHKDYIVNQENINA